MFTINENGVAQRCVWDEQRKNWTPYFAIPDNYCDMYKRCGPYSSCNVKDSSACECLNKFEPKDPQGWDRGDWSNGCIRRTPLNCQKRNVFLKYSGVKLPDTENSWHDDTMTLKECKVLCSKNCSCTAYTCLNLSSGNGCLLWFGDLADIRDISPGQDIYIRMASSELESEGRKRIILIVTLSLAIAVLILLSLSVLYLHKRKQLDHRPPETAHVAGGVRLSYVDNHPDESHEHLELPLFDLSTIIKATDNFSIENKLGEGGFGPVYKGLLEEGHEIAVKRLSRTSLQGVCEFKNEVICIAKLQHRNLVKLLGWCVHGEEKMLVYEYMTNKSLDLILFGKDSSFSLTAPKKRPAIRTSS